jgi:hypothetical protein
MALGVREVLMSPAISIVLVVSTAGCGSPDHSRGASRQCDANYNGACLNPNSPDYDCVGGSGNGPDYTGLVRVVGDDHFLLDRDGDGYACE